MNRRNLQNRELDRIGHKLFDAAKIRAEEIEQVVGSPMLFDAIKARIEIERCQQKSKSIFSGNWKVFQIWNRQRVAATILIIFTASVLSFIGFNKLTGQREIERAAAPKKNSTIEPIRVLPSSITTQISENSPAIAKIKNPVIESQKTYKQKAFINKTAKPQKSAARKSNQQQQRFEHNQKESAEEFYALAGNPVETGEELQIVRTELSRSSLFALGVNLSIENETEKIKTDLLVGADGVAKAIRLVNKTENQ